MHKISHCPDLATSQITLSDLYALDSTHLNIYGFFLSIPSAKIRGTITLYESFYEASYEAVKPVTSLILQSYLA